MVLCFRFDDVHLTFVNIILSSVGVAEWLPFWLLEGTAYSVDHMFSLYFD